jgi:hypothetical protein
MTIAIVQANEYRRIEPLIRDNSAPRSTGRGPAIVEN